ncbi:MAG: hypothetical protein ABL907_22495, partial [Hyphomicrobium sp.]
MGAGACCWANGGGGVDFKGGKGRVELERIGSPERGSGEETRLNMKKPPKTLLITCGPHPVSPVRAHYVEMSKTVSI